MSLGTKLTGSLLLGCLVIMGLDLYLNIERVRANLLHDLRREVVAIGRTLHIALTITGTDTPEQYFVPFATSLSAFENVLGVVFYDHEGRVVVRSATLDDYPVPAIDIRRVITTRTPVEGLFSVGQAQRYYRVEPIVTVGGESRAAMLILEDLLFFTRAFRDRAVKALIATLGQLISLASIVAVVSRRSVIQPLQTLTRQVETMGPGPFIQPLHTTRRDEIGRLIRAFDGMCNRLNAAYHTLATENATKLRLERRLHHSEKLAALGQLASRLAHEIGTPLNVIQGRAEQLVQRGTFADKDHALLDVIITQIDRISGFIRQLLTLAHRAEPCLRPVQLQDIVRQVWEVVSDRDSTAGVQVALELAAELPPALGDPAQLYQVFLNLSVNALQAVGPAGRVTLRTRWQPHGPLSPMGQIEVEVADTGPGIPAHDLPYIFEPFYTTKGLTGGTGLGLAISAEIVRSHNGEIRVESGPGQGSRFIVALPQASEETGQPVGGAGQCPLHPMKEGVEHHGERNASRPGAHSHP
jgi:signal transduction histidine kinase